MRYAHILVFSCPDCNLPIAITRISNEKNLEKVDAEALDIRCSYCESTTHMSAVNAKLHYVESWS
ncbi:MAG TPA: hypothetical protein VMH89_02570 [Candidatus Acidoferrum sp.]|nr:hypothetical protein [Candidatus Acidoferrum sp.]